MAHFVLKMLPGVERPAIVSLIPSRGGHTYMLDLGANAVVHGGAAVSVRGDGRDAGRRSRGAHRGRGSACSTSASEEIKGNEIVRAAHRLLGAPRLNYVGFVEGNDIFSGAVDVVVTDGFTGNVALKTMEGRGAADRRCAARGVHAQPCAQAGRAGRAARALRACDAPGPDAIQWRDHGRPERHRHQEPRRRRRVRLSTRHRSRRARGAQRRAGAESPSGWAPHARALKDSMYSRIAGTGSYLPEKILTNADLEKLVDTSDEWIRTRTGIERRHVARRRARPPRTWPSTRRAGRMEAAGVGPGGRRLDLRRHDDARPRVSERRHAAAGPPGHPRLPGLQPRGRVHRLHLRARASPTSSSAWATRSARSWSAPRCSRASSTGRIAGTCVLFADGAGAVVLQAVRRARHPQHPPASDGQYKDLLKYPDGVSKGFEQVRAGQGRRPDEGQRGVQGGGQHAGRGWSPRRWQAGKSTQGSDRLADPAPGEHPHHRGDGEEPRHADGAGHRDHRGPRQHLGRVGARSRSTPASATGASSAASCCCWRPSAAALPGDRR